MGPITSMMSIARWTLFLCFVFAVASGSARADDPLAKPKDPAAREHLSQGNAHYRLRDFEKAIEEYKAGALQEDAPVFLYNLGQCYRQLGKYEDAIWHYERFLSRGQPTGDLKTSVEEFVREMKAELDKKAMSQPPTEPAPESAKKPESQPTPVVAPPPLVATEHVEPWYADSVGWVLAGGGLLATATSGYLLLDAADLDEQANNEDRQDVRQQLRDKASSRRVIGAVVGIAGVGALATGIIKLAIHPSPHNETTASWGIGVTGNGVQVFGSF
jgi:tetratricopeptide (TPR) repeat protein